ncbi:hypothetical protein DV735_g891, partial [Chaetothyriales sp. CBS 134920]
MTSRALQVTLWIPSRRLKPGPLLHSNPAIQEIRLKEMHLLSYNKAMEGEKEPSGSPQPQSLWRRRRRYFILGGVIMLLIVIGLAVGLGVGLTRAQSPQCYYGHCPSSTSSGVPEPTPAPAAGNGTVINGIWQPENGTTWQYQLATPVTDPLTDGIDVWDLDLFDNEASVIADIQSKGSKVICYLSGGSYEDWRPDKDSFTEADYGNALDGWPGEYWLDTNSENVRQIMAARFDLAVEKGCNGVDPDNVDGYNNDNGLGLTPEDAIDYIEFLADEAAARNLSIGLKNALEIVDYVIHRMQWTINEQCLEYDECDRLASFIDQQKPVFHVEYPKGDSKANNKEVSTNIFDSICDSPSCGGFSTIIKNANLDTYTQFCQVSLRI